MVRDDRCPRVPGPWPSRGLALVLSLAILGALVSQVPFGELVASLRSVGRWPVIGTVLVALAEGLALELDKLRRILRHLGCPLSLRDVGAMALPAVALGALAPAQAEEVWKARQVQVRIGCPFGEALGIVAFDRGINLVSHLVLIAGGTGASWLGHGSLGTLAAALSLAFIAGIGGITLAARIAALGPLQRHAGILAFTGALRRTSPGFRAGMLAYACLANLALTGALWWMGRAAGVAWPLASAMAWRAGSVLLSKIPVSLGGLGVREGVLVAGLAQWTSSPVAVAVGLAFGLITAWVPPVFALSFQSWFRESMVRMMWDLRQGWRFVRRGRPGGSDGARAAGTSGGRDSGTGSPSDSPADAQDDGPQHSRQSQ
ncbi:MAG TPA: lysylphosphatidylglycerol synthase transmembrane domain-containing protein [Myxococcota bacterium]|nr:lysylphosphatidylglycerol synthase transmembrane domain-containing protein [Myxococcota bacterium]HQK51234.1 lysylphosphatidylglycerol synthase transmembrane domain-containing protein [Myxococcota bacterium]